MEGAQRNMDGRKNQILYFIHCEKDPFVDEIFGAGCLPPYSEP
jgi:hypothetical protein